LCSPTHFQSLGLRPILVTAKYTPFFLSPTTGDKGGTGQEVLMQMQETGVSRLVVLRWEVLGALNSPEKDLQAVGMG
jgi:hypothetical protein